MNIAITGGTGFLGGHLSRRLIQLGHFPTVIARGVSPKGEAIRRMANVNFLPMQLSDDRRLFQAFMNCDAIAHLAGINHEDAPGDYRKLHVDATVHVIHAARKANIRKILMVSYLKARPRCFSAYHESKWEAEELLRNSGLDFTILKPGMIYGSGDQMLTSVASALDVLPVFAPVGLLQPKLRPVFVSDMLDVMVAALISGRLSFETAAVLGPESITLGEIVKRVARAKGKTAVITPLPSLFHYLLAAMLGRISRNPLITAAQVRMLSEGMDRPLKNCPDLPDDLKPKTILSEELIKEALSL